MRENIARFLEDKYYILRIFLRSLLLRLHLLRAPTREDMQKDIEKMIADLNI